MAPWEDIAGLALGAAVAILSPLVVFLALRRRFLIEPRFAILGVVAIIATFDIFPTVFFAVLAALNLLTDAITNAGLSVSNFFRGFEVNFALALAGAVVNLTFGIFMLAILTPRDKAGKHALAFGIGAFGWISGLRGWGEVRNLITVQGINTQGVETAFGSGVHVSPSRSILAAPTGVAAVAQFMISLMLFMAAWGGWRSRRLKLLAAAYGLAFGLAALGALIDVFAELYVAPSPSLGAWSLVGVRESYQSALGLAAVLILYRFWGFFVALVSAESLKRVAEPHRSDDDEGGSLLAVWRGQSRRE